MHPIYYYHHHCYDIDLSAFLNPYEGYVVDFFGGFIAFIGSIIIFHFALTLALATKRSETEKIKKNIILIAVGILIFAIGVKVCTF